MDPSNISKIYLYCFIIIGCAACSQSEAQTNFEDQALRPPSGIVAMDATGSRTENGENDADDWRTAPDYSGLFEVTTPAFPNPVSFNSTFEILIDVKAVDAINGLYVYAFRQQQELATAPPLEIRRGTLDPGLHSIIISPQEFAQNSSTGTIGNTYRIIFYNGRQKVITYGDVLVQ